MPTVMEEEEYENPTHQKTETLFPGNCKRCGELPIYADYGIYIVSSNRRNWNQDRVEEYFWRIKNYLNGNGLQLNETKT